VHELDVFLEVCRDGVRRRAHVLRPRTHIMVRGEGRGEEPARLSDGRVETQPIAVARQRLRRDTLRRQPVRDRLRRIRRWGHMRPHLDVHAHERLGDGR
jgi:hypothetical protein